MLKMNLPVVFAKNGCSWIFSLVLGKIGTVNNVDFLAFRWLLLGMAERAKE
jgi:hypothetical protein